MYTGDRLPRLVTANDLFPMDVFKIVCLQILKTEKSGLVKGKSTFAVW